MTLPFEIKHYIPPKNITQLNTKLGFSVILLQIKFYSKFFKLNIISLLQIFFYFTFMSWLNFLFRRKFRPCFYFSSEFKIIHIHKRFFSLAFF